jgi:hypothetical protein
MKPWQGLLKKAPAEGKRKNKERRPKPEPEVQKLNAGHTRGQRNKLCSRALIWSPHRLQEAYRKGERKPENQGGTKINK